MTSTADPAFQQALDKLMVQVNRDNILAVGQVFQHQADELRRDYGHTEDEVTRMMSPDPSE